MKNFRVTYIPTNSSEKRWRFFEAEHKNNVHKYFNYGIILKALNWTDRNYNGSSYANSDGISFTITKLH